MLAVLALFGSIGAYLWWCFTYGPELSHKAGASVLQGIEITDREKPFISSELKRRAGGRFSAISILGVGEPLGGPRMPPQALPGKAWVLLNEHAADEAVLIMPRYSSYRVSCATVGRLPNIVADVDGYVLKHLSAICN